LPKSPLPAVTGAELVRALQGAGFNLTTIRGSHHRLRHPDGRATTVPVHAGKDVPKGTLRSVLRDTGLSAEDLRQFLGKTRR
jgi:predicted RNA binding protein YcfA (HicA-like mRNA interferase family)